MEKLMLKIRKNISKLHILLLVFGSVICLNCNSGDVMAASKIKISKKYLTLNVNDIRTLAVKNANKKVKWKSSKRKIVKITKTSGKRKNKCTVKAMTAGNATIIASVGKKKVTCKITVKNTVETPVTTKVPAPVPTEASVPVPTETTPVPSVAPTNVPLKIPSNETEAFNLLKKMIQEKGTTDTDTATKKFLGMSKKESKITYISQISYDSADKTFCFAIYSAGENIEQIITVNVKESNYKDAVIHTVIQAGNIAYAESESKCKLSDISNTTSNNIKWDFNIVDPLGIIFSGEEALLANKSNSLLSLAYRNWNNLVTANEINTPSERYILTISDLGFGRK